MANTTTVVASKKWWLNARDFLNGLLMSVLGAVVGLITELITIWINTDGFHVDKVRLAFIAKTAIAAAITYLIKKFLDPQKIIVINPTTDAIAKVKSGETIKVGTTDIAAKNISA